MKEHIMDNDALVKLKEFTRLQREQDQYNLNVINLWKVWLNIDLWKNYYYNRNIEV